MEYLNDIQTYAETHSTEELLRYVADLFPGAVRLSSSLGQEDQVLTDMIAKGNINVQIFTLDTGRLFYETYELLEKTTARYRIPVDVFYPDAAEVEALVRLRGINGFYESIDNRKACCHVRKVQPLARALAGARVWVTGIRADQSANRHDMPFVEWDEARGLYKLNPLLNWTFPEVEAYLHQHNVPYNTLHDKGFVSIGCAPCTRAIEPGEDPRAGRWWWETSQKECGLHGVKQ
ncbi:phosphoadenylyl-sulfate reductase [Dinghuibacter silviterrae]|uniref:Adenosine 5'-phosphosulfate reductase n=1 Tax=Dinghuibacter silviterrae TaxID=1539049 RepID=A0A4R8DMT8_9BACT|nr:phosphoadenylyl-sulfate reductase [Dinghuibacter silviterrae]TDW99311.1 phosphoadenylylsulfate reductase (thioredoxin) [Dinghuibacter silviterrae]